MAASISSSAFNSSCASDKAGSFLDCICRVYDKERGSVKRGARRNETHDELSQVLDGGTETLVGVRDHPLRLFQHPFLFRPDQHLRSIQATDHMSEVSAMRTWRPCDRGGWMVGSSGVPRFWSPIHRDYSQRACPVSVSDLGFPAHTTSVPWRAWVRVVNVQHHENGRKNKGGEGNKGVEGVSSVSARVHDPPPA